MSQSLIFACVGSREVTPEESQILRATAATLIKRGGRIRSGGAIGADTEWAFGGAKISPEAIEVSLPSAKNNTPDRVPKGALIRLPPYTARLEEIARAEWELKNEFLEVGLPPYDPETKWGQKVAAGKSWAWLLKDKPYTAQLMIRNADIIMGEPAPSVVLACFSPEVRGGGGTMHGWRLAKVLGLPCFNLREVADRERFKSWCEVNFPSKKQLRQA